VTVLTGVVVVVALVATGLADLRWLRVAQREHYLPGSATRFAVRWWGGSGPNLILAACAVLGVVLSPVSPLPAIVGAAAVGVGPLGLSLVGRAPGPVAGPARLTRVAAPTGLVQVIVIAAAVALGGGGPVSCLVALLSPLTVDAALAALGPLEGGKAGAFVEQARAQLERVHPTVVAITGSYGKTTTKVYVAHLLQPARSVVASPRSFNNRAGLSRAVNENLLPGTEVFVAEMGTYGPGEIADLCRWCPPGIAAITAIGPVHLERFGSEEAIVRAKSEIFGPAGTAVLNVDDPRLAAVADEQQAAGKQVIRCSAADPTADVVALVEGDRLVVSHLGVPLADVPAPDAIPGNVAVAVGLALAAGAPPEVVAAQLPTLPDVANRRSTTALSTGATAIDDTFNSNPAGCRSALATLTRLAVLDHKRVVVTPGMVELGDRQAEENHLFAEEAAATATHILIVGSTNRKALVAGAHGGSASVRLVETHEDAVEWVRANTGPGDVVLYENQLPDHYP
jgi:UDP-N-acetylmuramoyl-tripeptide--D-alanyl-D-alanine ligase